MKFIYENKKILLVTRWQISRIKHKINCRETRSKGVKKIIEFSHVESNFSD